MSERSEALAQAVTAIREQYGHQAVARGVPAQLAARRVAASDPLPPWWPSRLSSGVRTVELAGPRSCGKLSLALLRAIACNLHDSFTSGHTPRLNRSEVFILSTQRITVRSRWLTAGPE